MGKLDSRREGEGSNLSGRQLPGDSSGGRSCENQGPP